MLIKFNYDKKKARKAYRHRCWTEYWYLSVILISSFVVFIHSCVNQKIGFIFISVFLFLAIACIRNKLASDNCKMKQSIDITDEHLIIRWINQAMSRGHDFNYIYDKPRITKKKNVVPLSSIHNLKTDKKTKRITFDYCANKNASDIRHMVIYDVYDKSLIDELTLQINKNK